MIRSGYSKSHLNEDDADSWITVRGQYIPLDVEGKPIGGNSKVFGSKESPKVKSNDTPNDDYDNSPPKSDKPKRSRDTEKFKPKKVSNDPSILDGLSDIADTAKEMLGHSDGISDLVGEITSK